MIQKRILLVDDEPNIRVTMAALLERAGYLVDLAENGFSALRIAQAAVPDLVISDLRMPDMNGFELLSVIRQRFPTVPTVVISGEYLVHTHHSPLADAFFQKGSYLISDFLGKVSELVGHPVNRAPKSKASQMWTSTRHGPVMLTCIQCLRSFPIDPCDSATRGTEVTICIFCGAELEVQLVAIAQSQSKAAD